MFSSACYDQAISCYDRALASCPNYLDYDIAVIRSNIAACHLKLEDWKAAVDAATACIDCLERVIPLSAQKDVDASQTKGQGDSKNQTDAGGVIEIAGDDEEAEQEELKRIKKNDERRNNVARIRAKALMRRAKAKSQQGGWANLQGADEDYRELASMDTLPPDDRRIVQKALRELPAKINQAKDKEMADMMGKLKDVSSTVIFPFEAKADWSQAWEWHSQPIRTIDR